MDKCWTKICPWFDSEIVNNCERMRDVEKCEKYIPLTTQKAPVSKLPCDDGLNCAIATLEDMIVLMLPNMSSDKTLNEVRYRVMAAGGTVTYLSKALAKIKGAI